MLKLMSVVAIVFLTVTNPAEAKDFLFYFDVSDSARADHKAYAIEYARFLEENVQAGDRVFMLRLDGDTYNFAPFNRGELKAPSGGTSEKKKREAMDAARTDLIVALPKFLETTSPATSTNILGALVSGADYFNQNKIAAGDRTIVIFSDGQEASRMSKVNMEKQIPREVPASVKLPSNLEASIFMIGIRPPKKAGAQEAMRSFWEDAARKTGSKLVKYIMSS